MKPRRIPGSTVVVLLALISLQACVSTPRTTFALVDDALECVVLLHGLNRSSRAMQPMAQALHVAGFMTANVDYPSQAGSVEVLAPMAVNAGLDECRRAGAQRIHFVTHSIGGILVRYVHKQTPIPDLGRVVMLAPPNQGSEVVDITRNWPTTDFFAGEAGMQLGTDENSIPAQLGPVDFELGVIAGTATINPFMSVMLPDADDGKVTVARTRVDGMDDFLVVGQSHRFIVRSRTVKRNTAAFLRNGSFPDSTGVTEIF